MDLKIEIRNLNALHEATIRFEHAIREGGDAAWTAFTPSRFVYAFFTFNSVYSFNWKTSFESQKPVKWLKDGPAELDRIKDYLRIAHAQLAPRTAQLFRDSLVSHLPFKSATAIEELKEVNLLNASKALKELAKQLPGQLKHLLSEKADQKDFFASAAAVFSSSTPCVAISSTEARQLSTCGRSHSNAVSLYTPPY